MTLSTYTTGMYYTPANGTEAPSGIGEDLYNETAEDLPERLVIDPYTRVIALNYLNPYPGAPMVSEPVPEGVNIFNMMNLSVPENVSELGEWTVLINPNSTKYATLKKVFNVSVIEFLRLNALLRKVPRHCTRCHV